MIDSASLEYNFLDGVLETDHLICMAHARAKLVKAYNQGGEAGARKFVELMDRLYAFERKYKAAGLSPEEISRRRQGKETEVVVRKLRSLLDKELGCEGSPRRGQYMEEALRHLEHFWDGLFLYRKNGEYPIDNNLAERQVRPLAAKRKSILHYGSDEGARMASTYHSIVSTLRMRERSVWEFFGKFFRGVATKEDDYLALLGRNAG